MRLINRFFTLASILYIILIVVSLLVAASAIYLITYEGTETSPFTINIQIAAVAILTVLLVVLYKSIVKLFAIQSERKNIHDRISRLIESRITEFSKNNTKLDELYKLMVHDLRAPIRSVVGFGQILEEDAFEKLDKSERDLLHKIIYSGKRLDHVISSISVLFGIGANEQSITNVNLSDFANLVVKDISKAENLKNLVCQIEEDLWVSGEKDLLYLVMYNLLYVMFKFTSSDTNPTIVFGSKIEKSKIIYYLKNFNADSQNENVTRSELKEVKKFDKLCLEIEAAKGIIKRHHGTFWAETTDDYKMGFYFHL